MGNMEAFLIILMLAALGWALLLRGRLVTAEAELQRCCAEQGEQSERQLLQQHALLDSMVEGVLVLDAENRIELTNASLRQLLGLVEDVNGQSLEEAVPVAVRAELKELVRRTSRGLTSPQHNNQCNNSYSTVIVQPAAFLCVGHGHAP